MDASVRQSATRLLRAGQEHVKAITTGRFVPSNPVQNGLGVGDECVFMVVANSESEQEQAGVFSLQQNAQGSFNVIGTLPILSNVSIQVFQEVPPTKPLATGGINSEIRVLIEGGGQTLQFRSNHVLKPFLDEVRRFAAQSHSLATGSHAWMKWYDPLLANLANYLRTPFVLSKASAGDPGDEDNDLVIIKHEFVRARLSQRQSQYSRPHLFILRIGTFNVNGRYPSGSLKSWLGVPNEPDMFVLGFQELDLSTEALIYTTSPERENAWSDAILQELTNDYVKVASKQLVGMLLLVFARQHLCHHISHIASTSSGQGAMWMGNKGGVAIRFRVYDTVLAFVNSHLAAFDNMVDRRNSDYAELRRSLTFPPVITTSNHELDTVFDSDHTFWMGDQNYRIDLPDPDVRELLTSSALGNGLDGNYQDLIHFDQLLNQRSRGNCFTELTEGKITFPPTYRFVVGNEDGIAYDPKRRPAWTDRILYRTAHQDSLKQIAYESHTTISLSDHKPVSSTFSIELQELDVKALARVMEEININPNHLFADDENIPNVKVEPAQIELGVVEYLTLSSHSIKLNNSGAVAFTFRFVPPIPDLPIAAPWLSISPLSGIVLAGQTQTINLDAFIDHTLAGALNEGRARLDDVLVLHISHSKDYFIPISGRFLKTCFANDLVWLAKLPDAIRRVEDALSIPEKHNISAPREVIRLVNWLMENGLEEPRIFLSHGDPDAVRIIRECLDTGEEFPTNLSSLSIGQALLELLDSFKEPVIPASHHRQCLLMENREQAYGFLEILPHAHANVLVSTTAFLHFICSGNLERANALAKVFAPILLRDDPKDDPSVWLSPLAKRRFVRYFIL